jgi:hypothetical protein
MPAASLKSGVRVTPEGRSSQPQMPPFEVSDEASRDQLRLASSQGDAVARAVDFLTREAADMGGSAMAGEFEVAYAISAPEGHYEPAEAGGGLEWRAATGNVHVGVVVRDAQDGRLVPGVRVLASFLATDGRPVAQTELPFSWHPLVNQFAGNLYLPRAGRYTLHVDVLPPIYRRHDPINGDRYHDAVFAEFTGLQIDPGRLRKTVTEVRPDHQAELARAQGDALGGALNEMLAGEAVDGAVTRVDDYLVACAVEFAETFWVPDARGRLLLDQRAEHTTARNAHVEIAVMDARTGRFLPGLSVRGTLLRDERPVVDETVPLMWHPWLHHYGDNVRVPGSGTYTFRVQVEPPSYPRYGREAGRLMGGPVHAEFRALRLRTGQK